jgi:hypothetical protein
MTHDLISHGEGWRCTLCHAVFMSTMLLEEIMTSECAGRPLVLDGTEIPVVVDPSTPRNRLIFKFTLPEDESALLNSLVNALRDDMLDPAYAFKRITGRDMTPDELGHLRALKLAERKGERLLDAWMNETGEGE